MDWDDDDDELDDVICVEKNVQDLDGLGYVDGKRVDMGINGRAGRFRMVEDEMWCKILEVPGLDMTFDIILNKENYFFRNSNPRGRINIKKERV